MWRIFLRHPSNRHAVARVTRRLRVVLLLTCLVAVGLCTGAQGAGTCTLSGTVRDRVTGFPISGASVFLERIRQTLLTDQQGRFHAAALPMGDYIITASATGYVDSTLADIPLRDDLPAYLDIRLTPDPFPIPGMQIERASPETAPDGIRTLTREQIARSGATKLPELLGKVAGVFVSRGRPGESSVQLRGGESRHVLVRLDNHPINDPATGMANLDAIPLELVESVTIKSGGESAQGGSGPLAGVIDIRTRQSGLRDKRNFEAGYSHGSWEESRSNLLLENPLPIGGCGYAVSWERSNYDGNYPFAYSVAPRPVTYTGTRANNGTTGTNLALQFHLGEARSHALAATLLYGSEKRGLPDRASQQNESASRDDNRLLATLAGRFSAGHAPFTYSLGFSEFGNLFLDTLNSSAAERFHTHTRTKVISATLRGTLFRYGLSSLTFAGEGRHDYLSGNDLLRPRLELGRTNRISVGGALTASFRHDVRNDLLPIEWGIEWTSRIDRSRSSSTDTSREVADLPIQYSPKFAASLIAGNRLSVLLRGSYGKSFALPDLQSLFWKGDVRSQGNPSLHPERGEHSELSLELASPILSLETRAGVTWHHASLTDLVVWEQGQGGVWKPHNLASARITGFESFGEIHDRSRTVDLSFSYARTDARNRTPGANSFDNQLTFRPGSVTLLRLSLSRFGLRIRYGIRWVGKRYALPDNSRWYDACRLDDASLSHRLSLAGGISLESEVAVDNLRDIDYVLIAHYPMSGRTWRAAITFTKTIGAGGQ